MTATENLIDDVITLLHQRRQEGEEEVYLPSHVWQRLQADLDKITSRHETPEKNVYATSNEETAATNPPNKESAHPTRTGTVESNKVPQGGESCTPPAPGSGEKEKSKQAPSAETENQPNKATKQLKTPADWQSLETAVRNCQDCGLHRVRAQPLFKKGTPRPELMLIGSEPPIKEVEEILKKMVAAMRFAPKETCLTTLVKCRTPGGRWPEDKEVEACLPYLEQEIELARPKCILLLGEKVLRTLTDKQNISRWHGKWITCRSFEAMAIYSPLYMLDHPEAKREAWADLQELMRKLGKLR